MPEEIIGVILETTGEAIAGVAEVAGDVAVESVKVISEAVSESADAAGEAATGLARTTCDAIGEVLDVVADTFTSLYVGPGPQRRKDKYKGDEKET